MDGLSVRNKADCLIYYTKEDDFDESYRYDREMTQGWWWKHDYKRWDGAVLLFKRTSDVW